MNPAFTPATTYARDERAAIQYLLDRPADTRALTNLLDLPYVDVRENPDNSYLVGDERCRSLACATAYILARWW